MLVYRSLQIFQHVRLRLLQALDPLVDTFQLICHLHQALFFGFVLHHLPQLRVEEPRLLQGPLFGPDVLCLLELLRHLPVLLLPGKLLELFPLPALLRLLSLKPHHVLVCTLKLQGLGALPLRLAVVCLRPQVSRLLLLGIQPLLQLSNLLFLDLRLSLRIASRLLDLLEELLLLLRQIVDSADHLLFILVGLGEGSRSSSVWTREVRSCRLAASRRLRGDAVVRDRPCTCINR